MRGQALAECLQSFRDDGIERRGGEQQPLVREERPPVREARDQEMMPEQLAPMPASIRGESPPQPTDRLFLEYTLPPRLLDEAVERLARAWAAYEPTVEG